MGTSISDSPKPQTTSDASTQTVSEETNVSTAPPPAQPPTPHQDPQVAERNTKASKQQATEIKRQHDVRGQLLQKSLGDQVPSRPPKQVLTANEHFAPSSSGPKQQLTANEHFAPNNPTLFSASTDSPPGSAQTTSQNNQAKPAVSPFVRLQSAKPGSKEAEAVNKKMLDEAAIVLRNARPGQEDKVIETLARVKQAVDANGGGFLRFLNGNMDAIQGVLAPFGFRPMESNETEGLAIENFDRAVQRFRTMTPSDREAVRHPLSDPQRASSIISRIENEEASSKKEQTEAQQRDRTEGTKRLPDGSQFIGRQRDIKDAEQAARNRMAMQKLENIKSSGPLSLLGRVVGTAADNVLGTENLGEGLAAVGSLGDATLPVAARGRATVSGGKAVSQNPVTGGPAKTNTSSSGRTPVVAQSPAPPRTKMPGPGDDPWSGSVKVGINNSAQNSKPDAANAKSPATPQGVPSNNPARNPKSDAGNAKSQTANQKKDLLEAENVGQSKGTKTLKTNRMSRPAAETDPELKGLNDELKDLKDAAGDHLAGEGGGTNLGRNLPISDIKKKLEDLAAKGDQVAADLLREVENVQERQQKRARELGLLPPLPQK